MTASQDGTPPPRRPHENLVVDMTSMCSPWGPEINVRDVINLLVHRISFADPKKNKYPVPDTMLNGPALARRFRDLELGTGGLPPYNCLIMEDGQAQQVVPLSRRGAHASGGFNSISWSCAVVGEHDECYPHQFDKLTRVCAVLSLHNAGLRLMGHTEIPTATKTPGKICPAPVVEMDRLRSAVSMRMPPGFQSFGDQQVKWLVEQAGFVY